MSESSADRELLYGEVTDVIVAELRAGRQPDLEELARRWPVLADQFEGHVAQLAAVLRCAAEAPPHAAGGPDELPPLLGDFRIVREVGRGGMGVVYEAEQLSLRRRVALKVLPNACLLDPLRLQRFQQEAHAAARLHHPHIIPVFAVGCERGLHCYAMQFIDGQSVAALIQELRRQKSRTAARRGPADPQQPPSGSPASDEPATPPTGSTIDDLLFSRAHDQRATLFRAVAKWGAQAAEALHYAHEVGVIHRDVKPANLLLDGRGELWVADFGLARLRGESELTATGDAVGTFRYMSPEQALGLKGVADHRVDIYSLGATLYELLTLEPALPGDDRAEMFRGLLEDEPKPLRALDPAIPVDLETIVLMALRKEPGERYATAQELADDLRRFLDNRPVLARRPSLRERAHSWARRHATGLAAAGMALAVVAATLAASTVVATRAYREAALEQVEAQKQRARTRLAIDEMYQQLALEWMEEQGQLAPLQRVFLEKALAYYQEEARERGDDPEARFRAALVASRVASIQKRLGQSDEALRSYEEALAGLDRLAERQPDSLEVLALRGTCSRDQGILFYQIGRLKRADEAYRAGIALLESSVAAEPDNPDHRSDLAVALWAHAVLHQQQGRLTEAELLFQKAVASLEELTKALPDHPLHGLRLASVQNHLTSLLGRMGKPEQAEEAARVAVAAFDRLLRLRPSRHHREGLTKSLANHSRALMDLHRYEAARAAEAKGRQALQHIERLTEDFPADPAYRELRASCLMVCGEALAFQKKLSDAEKEVQAAAGILTELAAEFPRRTSHRRRLAETQLLLGKICARRGQLQADKEREGGKSKALVVQHLEPARQAFEEAVRLNRQLVKEVPEHSKHTADLVESLQLLGKLHRYQGRLPRAVDCYREANEVLEQPADAAGSYARWMQERRLDGHLALGQLLLEQRKVEEGLSASRQAVRLVEQVANQSGMGESPVRTPGGAADRRSEYAREFRTLSREWIAAGKPAEAIPPSLCAVHLMEQLVCEQPRKMDHLWDLASSYGLLGALDDHEGRTAEAVPFLRRQLELYNELAAAPGAGPVLRAFRAWSLATCPPEAGGDPARALELANQLQGAKPLDRAFPPLIAAAAHARLGNWQKVIDLLSPLADTETSLHGRVCALLAQAHHQLGKPEVARDWLGKAKEWAAGPGATDVELRLLLKEATAALAR
jgi:serine/threonine protein kinase